MCLYSGRLSGRCDERRAAGRDLLIENLILRQRLAVYTRATTPAAAVHRGAAALGSHHADLWLWGDSPEQTRRLGIQTVLTPVGAPSANPVAEHVIGTTRRECLDHMLVPNERHLRAALSRN